MGSVSGVVDYVKLGAAIAFVVATLYLAYIFFAYGVNLVRTASVVAGLLAIAVGFAMLSASVTVMRDTILALRTGGGEKREPQK